jgi:hypothetical protein
MSARTILSSILVFAALEAPAFTNLNDAYSAIGFDPNAPGNAVVVVFSDPHMCLDATRGITTNLDPRLVDSVNGMTPQPAKVLVAGDVVTSYSIVPGLIPGGDWYLTQGTNEMFLWLSGIQAFTNISQTNILWVPGNHDQDPRETNAEMFCRIFTNMPPYQACDIAGVRFLLVNGGNRGEPSDAQRQWLKQQVLATSPTQTVALIVHQPPVGVPIERGLALMVRDTFKDWPAPWWIIAGHGHYFMDSVYDFGRSNVSLTTIGTVNTNQSNGKTWSAGHLILCLSNGTIVGRIYYHFITADYQVMATPDWTHPTHFSAAFEQVSGLLWRRLKTPAPAPEMLVTNCITDTGYWWLYPSELQWQLPLAQHSNEATHFLVLATALNPDVAVAFSLDRTNWIPAPLGPGINNVYSFPIPPSIANSPTGYARLTAAGGENWVSGYGLATTNAVTLVTFPKLAPIQDQLSARGHLISVTNQVFDPYAPPDQLTFTMVQGPPDATVDPQTGLFSWIPSSTAPNAVQVGIKVADNGTPEMSSTQTFQIMLGPPPLLQSIGSSHQGIAFAVYGDSNVTCTIWASTNLLHWDAISTIPGGTMARPFLFKDSNASNFCSRFYKATLGDP